MTTIATADLPARLGELLARVAQGESIAITEAGKSVAHLIPAPIYADKPAPDVEKPGVRNVGEEMLAYRDQQKRTLGGLTFRDLIDEGRR